MKPPPPLTRKDPLFMKIPANGFTHGGKFHADDVFSTATYFPMYLDYLFILLFNEHHV